MASRVVIPHDVFHQGDQGATRLELDGLLPDVARRVSHADPLVLHDDHALLTALQDRGFDLRTQSLDALGESSEAKIPDDEDGNDHEGELPDVHTDLLKE